jgi:hypothetical protein
MADNFRCPGISATFGLGSVKTIGRRRRERPPERLQPMTYEEWSRLTPRVNRHVLASYSESKRKRFYETYLRQFARRQKIAVEK